MKRKVDFLLVLAWYTLLSTMLCSIAMMSLLKSSATMRGVPDISQYHPSTIVYHPSEIIDCLSTIKNVPGAFRNNPGTIIYNPSTI